MKINTKQAQLLAKKIQEKLITQESTPRITKEELATINEYFKKEKGLRDAIHLAQKRLNDAGDKMRKLGINYFPTKDLAIKNLEKKNLPSVNDISDQIILMGMFEDTDMNTFINKIIEKLTKK